MGMMARLQMASLSGQMARSSGAGGPFRRWCRGTRCPSRYPRGWRRSNLPTDTTGTWPHTGPLC